MRFATFPCQCTFCKKKYETPILSDFSYGEFIFTRLDAKSFRYLNASNSKIIETVKDLIKKANLGMLVTPEIIQRALGKLIDPEGGLGFTLEKLPCPECKRTHTWNIDDSQSVGFIEVEEASFSEFEKKSEAQKIQIIRDSLQ